MIGLLQKLSCIQYICMRIKTSRMEQIEGKNNFAHMIGEQAHLCSKTSRITFPPKTGWIKDDPITHSTALPFRLDGI